MELDKKDNAPLGGTGTVNKRFLYSFVLVLGIGAIQYGYSIGVYNSMQVDF